MPAATGESKEDAPAGLRDRVAELAPWYHTLDLGGGVLTEGMFDLRPYVDRYGLGEVAGLRVLDVGTFDGFWAFELERRGARVTSLDLDSIQQLDWPPRLRPAGDGPRGQTFRLAHEALGSSVERVGCSIYEATPDRLGGTFDLVFCGSVLIHLRDPMLALERMAALCAGRLIFAEEHSRRLAPFGFVRGAEFRGDSPWSTWWIPTVATWLRMAHAAGFEDVRSHARFNMRFRAQRGGVPHVVVHARGTA
ncbi:MAG: class I SAM-dependent methyltransferase [Thermoleophilaceae bacterium]